MSPYWPIIVTSQSKTIDHRPLVALLEGEPSIVSRFIAPISCSHYSSHALHLNYYGHECCYGHKWMKSSWLCIKKIF
jgi:hypothetical protein